MVSVLPALGWTVYHTFDFPAACRSARFDHMCVGSIAVIAGDLLNIF
jgi:hypothetical protein